MQNPIIPLLPKTLPSSSNLSLCLSPSASSALPFLGRKLRTEDSVGLHESSHLLPFAQRLLLLLLKRGDLRPPAAGVSGDGEREKWNLCVAFGEEEAAAGGETMNTDITASAKPEYPVLDRNPPFTRVVGNFSTLDYLRFVTITGVSVTVGYLSGIKPGIKGPSMVTGGLIGLMGGFMYAYQNSAGRIMGFFPNEDEVARYKK